MTRGFGHRLALLPELCSPTADGRGLHGLLAIDYHLVKTVVIGNEKYGITYLIQIEHPAHISTGYKSEMLEIRGSDIEFALVVGSHSLALIMVGYHLSNQSLDVEQSLFAFQSCRISRKTAIAAYYTVAGDYDGKRIAMTGLGNCSCSFWIAYDGSKGRIRDG